MREVNGTWEQAVASWDLDGSDGPTGKNGLDSYYKYPNGAGCPCARSSVRASVADMPGSFGVDGGRVYAQTYSCVDPDTLTMQASSASTSRGVFEFEGDNLIVENVTVESASDEDPEAGNAGKALWIGYGAKNRLKVKDVRCHGRCGVLGFTTYVDMLWENVVSTSSFALGGGNGWSGVRFVNLDVRGGHGNGISADDLNGASIQDPIVFDRLKLHRTFSDANNSLCGFSTTWDCSAVPGRQTGDPFWGSHGMYLGTAGSPNRNLSNLLIQNSVLEITYDGLGLFSGGTDGNVKVRNCTIGVGDERILTGSSSDPGNSLQIFNTVFLRADGDDNGGRALSLYSSPVGDPPTSNYNAFYVNRANGVNVPREMPWWTDSSGTTTFYSMEQVLSRFGQDANSLVVCDTGCSSSAVRAINRPNPWSDFADTSVMDGDGTDYTPRSGSPLINSGWNLECPETDFFGNPRNDGACDIGAVENQDGTPDTMPPAAVTNFVAADGGASITLSWRNSVSSDNRGTLVRVRNDRPPSGPTDGTMVCQRDAPASTADACDFASAVPGQTYHFSAYSYDQAGNYGQGASTTGTAGGTDTTPPGQVPPPVRTDKK
jgi:hypothetical protein